MAVTDDVKLYCYNEALRILKSRALSSVDEATERRRNLDSAWGASDEAVDYALSKAGWNFAMRSTKLEYDPGVEPAFGLQYACAKPDDFVRLETISASEYFSEPLLGSQYTDEAGYWFSDITPLYVRFVSNGDTFGMNSGAWPITFKKYLAAHLAEETCEVITGSTDLLRYCMVKQERALKEAKTRDVMDEGTKYPPPGAWVKARTYGSVNARRDER